MIWTDLSRSAAEDTLATRNFDKDGLVEAFHALGRMAYAAGKTVEISVYEGSALTLLYDWRLST